MLRRQFIVGLGSAAAWPVVAQQLPTPGIGLLQLGIPSSWNFAGFRQGLKDLGYLEGENLTIDVRWANDDPARLSGLATDLVHRHLQRPRPPASQRNPNYQEISVRNREQS